jgi:hypothetical protein
VNQWSRPLKFFTGSNLVDMGRLAVHARLVVGDSDDGMRSRTGGHEEGLRRTHGDAAGAELATSLDDRWMVNVGSVPVPPSPPLGGGQARRQLLARDVAEPS